MKKFLKIWTLALCALVLFAACQKEDENEPKVSANDTTTVEMKAASAITEYEVSPKFGKPNITTYVFKVYDLSGKLALSVKFYEKATGTTTYLPMIKVGNYWTLSTKITINGWYDCRYVYTISKANISSIAYTLCNTYNTLNSSGISSITWPFGADGSSWNLTDLFVDIFWMSWKGGTTGGTGYGWNEGTHTGYREQYSDDWNRGIGIQDFNAEVRSPLDGIIENPNGFYATSYGQSRFVSVVQRTEDGREYRFYVAHLNSVNENLYQGKYVRAGVTPLGKIGKSGTNSPHAHCNMRDITNGDDRSIKFAFDAVKNGF